MITKYQAYAMLIVLVCILGMYREYCRGRVKLTYKKPIDYPMEALKKYCANKEAKP